MKTVLKHCFGLWLVAVSTLHAQVPPPPGGIQLPPPAEGTGPRTNITPVLGTNSSFFQRNTNFGRPRVDLLTNVAPRVTNAAGAATSTTVVTPAGTPATTTAAPAVPGGAVPV